MLFIIRKSFLQLTIILFALLSLAGCVSTQPMALQARPGDAGDSRQLLLLSLRTSNQYHKYYQPNAQHLWVKDSNGKTQGFTIDTPYRAGSNYREYLVSFALPPGDYQITQVTGTSIIYPIQATFTVPIYTNIKVGEQGIVYLGRIDATLVKRTTSNQLRGGSIVPLVDEAAAGYSLGTFDIKIYDNATEDLAEFEGRYPVLIDTKITKAILPAWSQSRVPS